MANLDNRSENNPASPPSRVRSLPLFPLDMVIFPGMRVSLHIFEDRYKEMIETCLADDRLFGIVLLRSDTTQPKNPRRAKTHRIGCSARVAHFERLADGRLNIEIEGVERFRLIEQHEVESYRTGIVEPFTDAPLSGAEQEIAEGLCAEVQDLLKDFLTQQLAQLGQRVLEFDLPSNPGVLSLITACVLPIDNDGKQLLLEKTTVSARLDAERDVLNRAITQLRRTAPPKSPRRRTTPPRRDSHVAGHGRNNDPFADGTGGDAVGTLQFEQIHADRYRSTICPN